MNSTTAVVSLGILAGIGAGGALGYLAGTWRTRKRRQSESAHLVAILAELAKLRELLVDTRKELEKLQDASFDDSKGSRRALDTESEYMSTFESAGEDEEDFYDLPADTLDMKQSDILEPKTELEVVLKESDDLGKITLEKEEVCDQMLAKLTESSEKYPMKADLLWRLTRAFFHKSLFHKGREEAEEEKQFLSQGELAASQALQIESNSWQCHKWYAIVMGAGIKFLTTSEKIDKGNIYKVHVDRAIELNPGEANLYFFRGMWFFEVAALSWFERKAATMIYSSVPTASYQDALDEFMQAESLMPGQWKNNELMVAKCQLKLGQRDTAREWLGRASGLPIVTADDTVVHAEVEQLLLTEGY